MANPILKSDLIEDGLVGILDNLNTTIVALKTNLEALRGATVQEALAVAQQVQQTQQDIASMAALSAKVSMLEQALQKEQNIVAKLTADQQRLNQQRKMYKKLTDDEIKSISTLEKELNRLNIEMGKGAAANQNVTKFILDKVNAIDTENKSYNELQQTYNKLKDALNKMTTAERNETEAGKALTAQALKVRDTMNELQKATGNYTLQVGKYRAAFDGLGYSFQQILREAPSALNLNQFFLAISNNIPLFLDQLKAFKVEQAEIKANLEQMTKGTKEYAEQQEKVVSLGQKLGKVIFSWQSLVLIGLLALRNLPKIVDWFKELFGNVKELVSETMKLRWAMADLWNNVEKNVSNTAAELRILVNRLEEVKRGTEEYATIVGRINEITNSTLNTTTAQIDEVKRLTKAYMEQQIQLATNAEVVGRIGSNRANIRKRNTALTAGLPAADRARSITSDTEQQEELTKMLEEHEKAVNAYNDAVDKGIKDRVVRYRKRELNALGEWVDREHVKLEYRPATEKELTRLDQERMHWKVSAESYINDILGIVSQDIMDAWAAEYKAVLTEDKKNGPKGKQPTEQSTSDRYWEAEQELLEKMKTGYDLERALAKLNRDKEREELTNWYVDQRLALDENLKNGFISQQKYDADIQELDRENSTLREGINRKYWDNINKINREEAEKALKAREDRTIREINAITAVELKASSKRVRNTAQEAAKNNVLVENLNRLLNARKELIALDIASDETRSIEERTKALEKLNKEISKYASQLDFSKRLGTYSSLFDMITKNINVSDGNKKSILTNIIGEDAMKTAAESLGEGFEDWVDGQFETWINSATQAVSTWYSTTMGYINDLISAYVELANAKAEAAKEATDAAQEEYEKEKALLEAGYASRVEATWAEYQEKKAAQEKAEEDAKAAAKAQQEINNLSTMGSLITAAANIWKTFTEIPVVGIPLAIAATGTMFGAFLAAKIKANEVSKYGEGDVQLVGGGSHASGHDTLLGYSLQGKEMRVENGEVVGIVPRRSVRRIGEQNVLNTMRALRDGTFEANTIKRMGIERNVGMSVLNVPRTDLHKVESGIDKIVALGSRSIHHNPDGTVVETRKNARIVYKNI